MMNSCIETIMARSSYRGEYKNIPVPRADLITIMEAGLAAPSGCNQQTTSLIAVDDPAVLVEVKKLISRPICQSAPALICVLTKPTASYRGNSYHVQDYAAAIDITNSAFAKKFGLTKAPTYLVVVCNAPAAENIPEFLDYLLQG